MERKIVIEYNWHCDDFADDIPSPLADALEESAMERISKMMLDGYVSGELVDDVRIDVPGHATPEEGYVCRGWFDITKT